jgi:DNA processing protein
MSSVEPTDIAYAVALAGLPMMGPGRLRALLARRSPGQAWRALATDRAVDDPLVAVACGRDREKVRAVWVHAAARADPAAALARAERAGIAVHLLGDPDYPPELAADPEPPSVCFVLGDPEHLAAPARVAVIGTRSATGPGLDMARRLGAELAEAGVAVVSGLARGIDAAAHTGAVRAGGAPPIGVVGSGLDVPYPRANAALWADVARSGVLISEAPPGAPPSAWRFPARNRLIAGLADLVVVVESRASGGSMLTVREAIVRGRQVMAVPGSVTSPAADGTNQLIYDGCCPVRDALDVLVALGLSTAQRERTGRRRRRPRGGDGEVLALFDGGDTIDVETIARVTMRSLADVGLALGRLEVAGWVTRNGAWWQPT